MRLLWLCNREPGPVRQAVTGKKSSGLWMDHVLSDLRKEPELEVRILSASDRCACGSLDDGCSYALFVREKPAQVSSDQQNLFRQELKHFRPDVIHIWGTEFGHTLAMMEACKAENLLDRVVISIQGLCSIYARHYNEGIPLSVQKKATFRDRMKGDNLLQQQKTFERRGENEVAAMQLSRHVIGRTDWDRACARLINPQAQYHFCNETLREPFYEGSWRYEGCKKHRIFASSCIYPIKGFHYLLEALAEVRRRWPDAVLAVPGNRPEAKTLQEKLRQDGYAAYLQQLMERYELGDCVEFLGSLTAEQMKENYLKANVFVLPSTIENSPNSMGEAMLLGVPVAAADVGGVKTMLKAPDEGLIYQSTASYMLADAIETIFAMEEKAEEMGKKAADHARKTHNPEKNCRDLLNIYREIGGSSL